jgi:hypothetical protein
MPRYYVHNSYQTFRTVVTQSQKKVSPRPMVNIVDHSDGKIKIMEITPELHKKIVRAIAEERNDECVGYLPGTMVEKINAACKRFGLDPYPSVMHTMRTRRPTRGSVVKESEDLIEIRF